MQPGQLVVCIAANPLYYRLLLWRPDLCPKRGLVYTVDRITRNCQDCGGDHLTVEEISLPADISGFPAEWFKPCREADFDLFMARLLPINPEQRVEG